MRSFFRQPIDDVVACLERLVDVKRPGLMMFGLLLVGGATWFVYVPIHELLHVAGCVVTGGTVTELELSPRYGAAMLQKVFPFIVSGGDYAGRVTGFDTKGSDWIYLATDFGPFLLSIVLGVPLLKLAGKKRRPVLFPIAVVVGLAPFYNIQGDYYEMGSIVTTRALTELQGGGNPPAFEKLRADDIFKLLGDFVTDPGKLGVKGAKAFALATLIIVISFVLDVIFAFATYWLGHQFAHRVVRIRARSVGRQR